MIRTTANIVANIYEGRFQVNFDCVGELACRFALCHTMPPDGNDECTYREYSSCLCQTAKISALESLKKKSCE
jgi:hypothetical protein